MSALKRVLPDPVTEGGLTVLPISPTKEWIRCTCGHAAWKIGPSEWECGCPVGPRGCHGPRQVADADGTPQIVYGAYRLRTFPDSAA